jgi:hypothetical protein
VVGPIEDSPALRIEPRCTLGCGGPGEDPFPDDDGLWLGPWVSPAECATYSDADVDGLGDFCEEELAEAFSPELYYWKRDNVDGEPKWAAMPWLWGRVRIFYALSYYEDLGPVISICPTIGNDWLDCWPHYGDSEAIVIDVGYNDDSQHWYLEALHLSRHGSWDTWYPGDIYFDDKNLGYPRVWVARKKHANYISDHECDNGEPDVPFPLQPLVEGIDDCESTETKRPVVHGFNNLGSFLYHTSSQGCFLTTSTKQAYQGQEECYWSGDKFRGWVTAAPNSDPYINWLKDAGFGNVGPQF